ncbi:MAG: hypothetical protein COA63_010825 [Methylophaga sp.]|nr:hypothetical protein [Methylophaga sp.]
MGYFANGSEGADYQVQYCDQCVHSDSAACAVWDAHLEHNSNECNNEESILHSLIPRGKDGIGNDQCAMFIPNEIDRRK